ncbi:unnamed protein product [Mytilus edulis]|uniref:YqaJ viral recombinase domain-containing protein n=1 Tax=Mytilus edulis TaxID=6550 RepID=A0A8S3QZS7_MYTED|nr:unnamed protein product [Mytilus edulis]
MPKYNESEIQKVMLSTIGQSSNEKWHEIRSGRLTSSNFYEIHTKVQSYKKKEGVTFDPLISRLMGYKKLNPNIRSLKHGREMEPEAKLCYLAGMKKAGHTDVNITECGIFLDKDMTYLGASPDILVDCACCGSGVVEIKCPLVQKCGKCTTFCSCCVPDYLYVDGTRYSLKKHKYYGQIQGQLAITGRKYCDFFIYTCNGTFCQRIVFDKPYYDEIVDSLKLFFEKHFVPELFSGELKMQTTSNVQELCTSNNTIPIDDQMEFETTYFCPSCNHIVKNSENVENFIDHSICCDICDLWYHFRCKYNKKGSIKVKAMGLQKMHPK